MITDLTRLKQTKLEFVKTIQTRHYKGGIITVHLTEQGKKISEIYDCDQSLSGLENHLLACLRLTEHPEMQNEYWCILEPTSYQQAFSAGFTFSLTTGIIE